MLKITQIPVKIGDTLTKVHIAKKLHAKVEDIQDYEIDRESFDARGEDPHFTYTVYAHVKNEVKYAKRKDVTIEEKEVYTLPKHIQCEERPIVVGFGPAGMYAALILAECGARPIVLERGCAVEERTKQIETFFAEGKLDPESNVQFGEGGAGTFSDGKLTTRVKNVRIRKVLEEFVEAGASPSIIYEHRAHLGTDKLRSIVRHIREKVIALGGEVHFSTRVDRLLLEGDTVIGVHTNQGDMYSHYVILATGHSAVDTYQTLLSQGVCIEQKDFAAGVRVEHPQSLIDHSTYGKHAGHPALGAASYQLTAKTSLHRGVYSFCMCPGGMVIPASCEEGTLVVNGMSYSARDKANANSAILVQIPKSDFDHGHPLDGFVYQKELEKRAYRSNFQAPAQNIKDYLSGTVTDLVIPTSYPRGVVLEDMHALFSDEVNTALMEGMKAFDRKIHGFIEKGIMVGMESRSSSPIRLPRDQEGVSITIHGLYPCGEGAGYAGGIVSSAVDGIKQAEHVIFAMSK